jgi:hypothetical protein
MQEHGGSRAYGLLTIGASWEFFKYSLAKGIMESISTERNEAVKTLYHLKRTLDPMSPIPSPPDHYDPANASQRHRRLLRLVQQLARTLVELKFFGVVWFRRPQSSGSGGKGLHLLLFPLPHVTEPFRLRFHSFSSPRLATRHDPPPTRSHCDA